MLAKPLDSPQSGDNTALAANFTSTERPAGAARPNAARPASQSETPATTTPPPTTTPPTTSTTATTPSTTSTTPPPTSTTVAPSNPEPPQSNQPERVVELVNQARTDKGCQPVRIDEHLTAAAVAHSSDMSDRNHFSHTTPEGVTFDERIKAAGYPLPGAENIARGQRNAQQVMDAWMASSGHKANILNCQLTAIGVGLDPDGFYWTQDFGY